MLHMRISSVRIKSMYNPALWCILGADLGARLKRRLAESHVCVFILSVA